MQVNISPNQSYNNVQFKAKAVDIVAKKLPKYEIPQKFGRLEKQAFKQYMLALSTAVTFSALDMLKLNGAKDNQEYAQEYIKLFCDKHKIPEEIRPQPISMELHQATALAYDAVNNVVVTNSKHNFSKNELFASIRHEMQHYLQSIQLFQHKELGPKYLEHIAEASTLNALAQYSTVLFNLPEEAWGAQNEEELNMLREIKRCFEEDGEEGFAHAYDVLKPQITNGLNDFRDKVIKNLSEIPADSPKTKTIQKYYDGLVGAIDYYNPDGSVKRVEYMTNPAEYDAVCADTLATAEAENLCFMKVAKTPIEIALGTDEFPEAKEAILKILKEKPDADFFIY